MKDSRKPKKWLMTKEMMEKLEQFYQAHKMMQREYAGLFEGIRLEETCPTICEISSSIRLAMMQIADIVIWLRIQVVENRGDFSVQLDASFDQNTELISAKAGRCSGDGAVDWSDFDGKKFSECMDKIREWLYTLGNSC